MRTIIYNKKKKEIHKNFFDAMAKSANLYARIEPKLKEQAEKILSTLGIPASNTINMFYNTVYLEKRICGYENVANQKYDLALKGDLT